MELKIGNCSAVELAKVYGTPLYVYDKQIILKRISELKENFPTAHICYALKANSNPQILKLIASTGLGADCSNSVELEYAKKSGFNMENSSFTAVNPRNEDLAKALELNVMINLDDISILKRLLAIDKPQRISFRINPGFGKGKFPGIVVGGHGTKFGMNEDLAREAYRQAKEAGIERFGIHMMTGSCVLHNEYFQELTLAIQEITKHIEESVGISFEYINIGGGFGIPYEPHEKALDIKHVAHLVNSSFKHNAKLALEPGRYIVGESGFLLTQVTTIKNNIIGVDAGMSTLLRPALYNAYHPIVLANNIDAPFTQEANIAGPCCENTDFFAKNRAMPTVIEGNILAVTHTGAYSFVMASRYNGQLLPTEVLVDGENHKIIRKREKVEDLKWDE